ncbi:hypothetical protein AVEN_164392-1 [Araneus ventricosus]|uniref:Uncharacterized protein n=1 Tax=Araneus ventricosus TaxID=182803 RepID=A0A4Y2VU67_ARAVE|nr:hypothetical protein AVEN_164392-1 [Araneus ventricosus]
MKLIPLSLPFLSCLLLLMLCIGQLRSGHIKANSSEGKKTYSSCPLFYPDSPAHVIDCIGLRLLQRGSISKAEVRREGKDLLLLPLFLS